MARYCALFALMLVSVTANAREGFDNNYEAYIGDHNQDGYEDIYVRQKPQVVILAGDISIPIVLPPPVEHFVLVQNSAEGGYSIQSLDDNFSLAGWRLTEIEARAGDLNVDGLEDLLLVGVAEEIIGAFDQVVFSDQAGLAQHVTEVDREFTNFYRDLVRGLQDPNYFAAANVPTELPTFTYAIAQDLSYCFTFFGFIPSCFSYSYLIYSQEFELNLGVVNDALPYLSDPNFRQAAGELLDDVISGAASTPPIYAHITGKISGCHYYCDSYYGPGYATRIYDLWIPTTEITPVFDRENFSLAAASTVEVLERALDDDFSKGNPWPELSQAFATVLGLPSFGYDENGNTDPQLDPADDLSDSQKRSLIHAIASVLEHSYQHSVDAFELQLWLPHEYNVSTSICDMAKDTVLPPSERRPAGTPTRTIPASICTLENTYCWAKRNPAPRDDESDESTISEGEPSELYDPIWGTNPIFTFLQEEDFTLVNQTRRKHRFHDRLAADECGLTTDLTNVALFDEHCAIVQRITRLKAGSTEIEIATHGQGYNPPGIAEINEWKGSEVFEGVDEWVRHKLATEGECTDDP
jgi:hypothetical protein